MGATVRLITSGIWKEITHHSLRAKQPSHVAVAYFGQHGDDLLPLKSGSILVVDASIANVSAGVTCPAALERLRRRGVGVFTAAALHAKVFAFDKVAFGGSCNASRRSESVLQEAVVRVDVRPVVTSVREFVNSLCITQLTARNLRNLSDCYRPPRAITRDYSKSESATLIMELTHEQGGGRETQVQPPKGVWGSYFGISTESKRLPTLSFVDSSGGHRSPILRRVVRHHHNLTIELPGTELPRPAILQVRRLATNRYSYRVFRPHDKAYADIRRLVTSFPNRLWDSGRRWVLI